MGLVAAGERAFAGVRSAVASMSVTAIGGFFRRVIRGIWEAHFGQRDSSLGFGRQTVVLKEGEKEVEGEVSKKDGY